MEAYPEAMLPSGVTAIHGAAMSCQSAKLNAVLNDFKLRHIQNQGSIKAGCCGQKKLDFIRKSTKIKHIIEKFDFVFNQLKTTKPFRKLMGKFWHDLSKIHEKPFTYDILDS